MKGPRVAVIGLGAMGSAVAGELARRGAQVWGFEQFQPVHDRGSSHGDSRIVRRAYFEHPDYVPMLDRAYLAWERLESRGGRRLFHRTGALMIGPPDSPIVAGTLESVRRWSLDHEVLDRRAMATRFPPFVLADSEIAVFEADAGYVQPEEVVRLQLDLAAAAGADLRFDSRMAGWSDAGEAIRLDTDSGAVEVDHVVVTAGSWAGALLGAAAPPLQPSRAVMFRFEPADPEPFHPQRFPSFVFDVGEVDGVADALYGVGDLGAFDDAGNAVHAAKVGFHYRLQPVDPDSVADPTADEIATMHSVLAARIPGLAGRCVRAHRCLYTMTPDEHFVVGPLPADSRVTLAVGFSGHGFKFAPVLGEVLADLVLDGATTASIALFDPRRFQT